MFVVTVYQVKLVNANYEKKDTTQIREIGLRRIRKRNSERSGLFPYYSGTSRKGPSKELRKREKVAKYSLGRIRSVSFLYEWLLFAVCKDYMPGVVN
jgi:hypothetical protein